MPLCSSGHIMDMCPQHKRKMHRDQISFLKENGICFWCLISGHIRKDYTRHLSCKVCNQTHPNVLNIGKMEKEKGTTLGPTEESETSKTGVKVSLKACGHIGLV